MFEAAAILWACLCALLLACLATWSVLLWRWRRGFPIIALEPRQPVPWGLLHLLAALLLMTLFEWTAGFVPSAVTAPPSVSPHVKTTAVQESPRKAGSITLRPRALVASAIIRVAMVFAAVLLICVTTRASARDLGMVRPTLRADLRLGLCIFLMFGPLAYGIQMVLSQWIPGTHPILQSLRTAPDASLMIASVFSAVVVAPVHEEFLWRLLFQGWLEKLDLSTNDTTDLWVGNRTGTRNQRTTARSVPHWPILFSSALFALLHLEHGPAAVALFVFAVGLGWTYQRTHRIWPCVIAHLLLNACSLALLFLEMRLNSGS